MDQDQSGLVSASTQPKDKKRGKDSSVSLELSLPGYKHLFSHLKVDKLVQGRALASSGAWGLVLRK